MTPELVISFKDGTEKRIALARKVVVARHSWKQAIEFRETTNEGWILCFTERTMDGKKIRSIRFDNPTP